MAKPRGPRTGEPQEQDDESGRDSTPRRIRLRPREGSEHRFGFARRWEARRRARRTNKIWLILSADVGIVVLIYLIAREIVGRLGGD